MNNYSNHTYSRVSKKSARKAYENGKSIFIVPCKVACIDSNVWITPLEISKEQINNEYQGFDDLKRHYSFDNRVNNYSFYNCNYEMGYYPAYYIKSL